MRELKFRAWNKKKKCFIHHDTMNIKICDINNYKDLLIFQEYTGLEDKNGVEIYEGDILNYGIYGNFKVVYNKSSFKIQRTDHINGNLHLLEECCFDEILILGNIYENPELLEEI